MLSINSENNFFIIFFKNSQTTKIVTQKFLMQNKLNNTSAINRLSTFKGII